MFLLVGKTLGYDEIKNIENVGSENENLTPTPCFQVRKYSGGNRIHSLQNQSDHQSSAGQVTCFSRFYPMVECRVVDPHSFFADPDPAVHFNGDPDPEAF